MRSQKCRIFQLILMLLIFGSTTGWAVNSWAAVKWPKRWPQTIAGMLRWEEGAQACCDYQGYVVTENHSMVLECPIRFQLKRSNKPSAFRQYNVRSGSCQVSGYDRGSSSGSESVCGYVRDVRYYGTLKIDAGSFYFYKVGKRVRWTLSIQPSPEIQQNGTRVECSDVKILDETLCAPTISPTSQSGLKITKKKLLLSSSEMHPSTTSPLCNSSGILKVDVNLKGKIR